MIYIEELAYVSSFLLLFYLVENNSLLENNIFVLSKEVSFFLCLLKGNAHFTKTLASNVYYIGFH